MIRVFLLMAIPAWVLGYLFLEEWGVLGITFFGLILVFYISLNIEKYVFRKLGCQLSSIPIHRHSGSKMKFAIFDDAIPNALVVKSLNTRGTLFLSRGLFALLSDEDLEKLFEAAQKRTGRFGMVWAGTLAVFSHFWYRFLPHSHDLHARKFVFGTMFYPYFSAFSRFQRRTQWKLSEVQFSQLSFVPKELWTLDSIAQYSSLRGFEHLYLAGTISSD